MSPPPSTTSKTQPCTYPWHRRNTFPLRDFDTELSPSSPLISLLTLPQRGRPSSAPAPQITVSDWQPEEPSPALYIFLKNVPPPPPPPPSPAWGETTRQRSNGGSGRRRDSVIDEEFWHGNGRMRDPLDGLVEEFLTADLQRRLEGLRGRWKRWVRSVGRRAWEKSRKVGDRFWGSL
jgi:hypothetical protein